MAGAFRFVKSAVGLAGCPEDLVPEVAVLGRSNAGKSSLINAWTGSALAKTSSAPGKTRLINFFEGRKYRLVDFPGYGYSARSGAEQASWAEMIEPVLAARGNFRTAMLLVDCRRAISDDERILVDFLRRRELPVVLVLTKADKLNQSEEAKVRRQGLALSGIAHVALVSSQKKLGLIELEDYIFRHWIQPHP